MKIFIVFVAFLLIPTALSQLVIDFPSPEIETIKVRQSEEGIFCNAKTNDGSWPIYRWYVNDRRIADEGQLLTSGFSPGDKIACEVIATTGYLNESRSESITATGAPPPITGAITGVVSDISPGLSILAAVFFGGLLVFLIITNYRLYSRHKDNERKRKYLE